MTSTLLLYGSRPREVDDYFILMQCESLIFAIRKLIRFPMQGFCALSCIWRRPRKRILGDGGIIRVALTV